MNKGVSNSYNVKANPATGYLFSLWGFMLLFVAGYSMVVSPLFGLFVEESYQTYVGLILQGTLVFALPAWLVEHYYRRSHFESVWRLRWGDISSPVLLWGMLAMTFAMLGSFLLEVLMDSLPVPVAFAKLEEQATQAYEALLSEERWGARALIYVGTIVVAPIAEELFFRGAMQGWILSWSGKVHMAVWVTALLFSLMHMQWSGFPSRMLLGVVLGYVAVYGGLWLAILMHMVNNVSAFIFDSYEVEANMWWIIATIIVLVIVVVLVRNMKRVAVRTAPEEIDYDEE